MKLNFHTWFYIFVTVTEQNGLHLVATYYQKQVSYNVADKKMTIW